MSCRVFQGHSNDVNAVVFSPDGKLVACASRDCTAATGRSCRVFQGHSHNVNAVVFSPDGKLVASASYDNTVRLWNRATGEPCRVFQSHSDDVKAVAFSPDGKLVASASYDKTIRLWDVTQKTMIEEIYTGQYVFRLNFTDRTQLDTDRGTFTLTSQLPSTATQATLLSSIYVASNGWVIWNDKRVLYLPIDYRPSTATVKDNILVMGHESGGVTFLHFNPTAFPL